MSKASVLFSLGLENTPRESKKGSQVANNSKVHFKWMSPWEYLQVQDYKRGGSRNVHLALHGWTTRNSAGSPAAGPHSDAQWEESPPGTEPKKLRRFCCRMFTLLTLPSTAARFPGTATVNKEPVSRVESLILSHSGRGGTQNPSPTNRTGTPPRRRVK